MTSVRNRVKIQKYLRNIDANYIKFNQYPVKLSRCPVPIGATKRYDTVIPKVFRDVLPDLRGGYFF